MSTWSEIPTIYKDTLARSIAILLFAMTLSIYKLIDTNEENPIIVEEIDGIATLIEKATGLSSDYGPDQVNSVYRNDLNYPPPSCKIVDNALVYYLNERPLMSVEKQTPNGFQQRISIICTNPEEDKRTSFYFNRIQTESDEGTIGSTVFQIETEEGKTIILRDNFNDINGHRTSIEGEAGMNDERNKLIEQARLEILEFLEN